MTKLQIRRLKSHYLSRWAVMRHNQKNQKKILVLEDQFVLRNLIPGSTLCYNCLGEIYQGMIDLSPRDKYDNLVLINNIEFINLTVDQTNVWIENLANQFLKPGGKIIVSLEHKFIIYNRVEISVNTLISTWFTNSNRLKLTKFLNLLGKTNPGYGDYFFCIDYV
jgi:hypothetical protein